MSPEHDDHGTPATVPPTAGSAMIATPRTIGRYTIKRELGRGGLGVVYLATDPRLHDSEVAIKVPRPDGHDPKGSSFRFLQEAVSAARQKHPNLVSITDHGLLPDGTPFVVMPYFPRGSLETLLREHPGWRKSPRRVAAFLRQVCEAVHDLNSRGGLVHRDLKPANILIDRRGRPVVADYGLAVSNDDHARNAAAGTLAYMSPEQLSEDPCDGRADVWSIGVILYQLLTGRLPFEGKDIASQICSLDPKPPRQENDRIPARLEEICLKCLSREVKDRYRSAGDVALELRRFSRRRALPWVIIPPVLLLAGLPFAALPAGWRASPPRTSPPLHTSPPPRTSSPPPTSSPAWPAHLDALPCARLLKEIATGTLPASPPDAPRPELSLDLLACRRGSETFTPLNDGEPLASFVDNYFLMIRAKSGGYLYVFQVDSAGKTAWLFPQNDWTKLSTGSNPVRPGDEIVLPSGEEAFHLDENTGYEHVYAVFSAVQWPALEAAAAAVCRGQQALPVAQQQRVDQPVRIRGVGGTRWDRRVARTVAEKSRPPASAFGGRKIELSGETSQATGKVLLNERWFRHVPGTLAQSADE